VGIGLRLCGVAAAFYALGLVWLGHAGRSGPAHVDLDVPVGIPATLTVPGEAESGRLPEVLPLESRPPVVLLLHGYSNDRVWMQPLARTLAMNGYAALAIDFRGHGENRTPFARDPDGAHLFADTAAAVDWLRTAAWVDGSRLAVVGFSMGASAALRFAERDSGVDAAVMVAGGRELLGPYHPPNPLFLWAEGDPERTRTRVPIVASTLAGVNQITLGQTAGDFAARNAVRAVEIGGADHVTVMFAEETTTEILAWLDATFEIERAGAPERGNPLALPTLVLSLLLLPVLVGTGALVGALARSSPVPDAGDSPWAGLAWLSISLATGLAAVAAAPLASFVAQDLSESVAAFFAIAGGSALVSTRLHGRPIVAPGALQSAAAGAVGFAAVYVVLAPLLETLHRATPTPERALVTLVLALLFLPFFLAVEGLLHRGRWPVALAAGLLGRVLTVAMLLLGVSLGILPPVVNLMLAPLALVLVLAEFTSIAAYARSRDRLAAAVLQAGWVAWAVAILMPMRA